MSTADRWFILGAGAIGSLWAAHLKASNTDCSLIIRPESWNKYKDVPLILCHNNVQKQFSIERITADTISTPIKKLILTVKASDAISAINSIKSMLTADATVLILLNGMGIQQQVAQLLPGRNLWLGSTTDGAWVERPLKIHHAGKGITWIGPYNNQTGYDNPLPPMELDIRVCDNIHTRLWHKLAINSVINGLTARYQCTNGELLASEERLQRVQALAEESEKVLKAASIPIDNHVLDSSIHAIKQTSENRSSTLQDAMHNQPTELPWINGFLLAQAHRFNIELHEHKRLMHELHQMHIQ